MKDKVDRDGLLLIFQQALKEKRHIYELLNEAGLIKDMEEFV